MFLIVIVIVIFSLKFINYFINNINYKKKIYISKTNNNIQNFRIQEPWVLMEDPTKLSPYARLIDLGF